MSDNNDNNDDSYLNNITCDHAYGKNEKMIGNVHIIKCNVLIPLSLIIVNESATNHNWYVLTNVQAAEYKNPISVMIAWKVHTYGSGWYPIIIPIVPSRLPFTIIIIILKVILTR